MVPRRDCACNHQTIPAGGVFPLATEMQAAVKYVKTGSAQSHRRQPVDAHPILTSKY